MYGEILRETQLRQLNQALEQSLQPREPEKRSNLVVTEWEMPDEPA